MLITQLSRAPGRGQRAVFAAGSVLPPSSRALASPSDRHLVSTEPSGTPRAGGSGAPESCRTSSRIPAVADARPAPCEGACRQEADFKF